MTDKIFGPTKVGVVGPAAPALLNSSLHVDRIEKTVHFTVVKLLIARYIEMKTARAWASDSLHTLSLIHKLSCIKITSQK